MPLWRPGFSNGEGAHAVSGTWKIYARLSIPLVCDNVRLPDKARSVAVRIPDQAVLSCGYGCGYAGFQRGHIHVAFGMLGRDVESLFPLQFATRKKADP